MNPDMVSFEADQIVHDLVTVRFFAILRVIMLREQERYRCC